MLIVSCLLLMASLLVLQADSSSRSGNKWKSDRYDRFEDPKMMMTVPKLINHYGYPVEVHPVITTDGYILELHRIPSTKCSRNEVANVVFLLHGLLGTSAQWLRNSPNSTLPFLLADLGYDVWLGNSRGNTYSRKHMWLDPDAPGPEEPPYWDFSWDELGKYDLTASFHYILKVTRREKLSYICLSFGCTLFFIAAIENKSLNDQVEAVYALAPSTLVAHLKNPGIRVVSSFYRQITGIARKVGVRAFADINFEGPIRRKLRHICQAGKLNPSTCRAIYKKLDWLRTSFLMMFPNTDRQFPTGTSFKAIAQFQQNIVAGDSFKKLDLGPEENFRYYGTTEPMNYDLNKVTAPVYVFLARKDDFASPEDITLLMSRLPNVKASFVIPDEEFGHFDFIKGSNANEMVNYPLISLLPPPCLYQHDKNTENNALFLY